MQRSEIALRKEAIERRLKGRIWKMQQTLDDASASGEIREGTYVTMCAESRTLFEEADEFTAFVERWPARAVLGDPEQRRSNNETFWTQRAMNHEPVWMDSATNHGGEEVIAQLENALKYYMSRTMRLENEKTELLCKLRDETSQHMRYNALKKELNAMLSANMMAEIKTRARERAVDTMKARITDLETEQQAVERAEAALFDEASNNSRNIERWARKAKDLLQTEGQTAQDCAYAAMILRALRDRSGL